jgi:hypothetical protein
LFEALHGILGLVCQGVDVRVEVLDDLISFFDDITDGAKEDQVEDKK